MFFGHEGESIVIFGAGGVGLCALMMAKYMKLSPVIVADISEERLKLAKKFGADIAVNVAQKPLEDVMQENGLQNVDHLVEVTGNIRFSIISWGISASGWSCCDSRQCASSQIMKISPSQFNMGKSILGTWGGDNQTERT